MDIVTRIKLADPKIGELFDKLNWMWLDLPIEYPSEKRLAGLVPAAIRESLIPFVGLGSGGYFCLWNDGTHDSLDAWPVVLVDCGEQRFYGVAKNLRELVGLFPYTAYTLMDILGAWHWFVKDPDDRSHPTEDYATENLEELLASAANDSADDFATLQTEMDRLGFRTQADPAGVVGKNMSTFAGFESWLKQHA